MHHIDSLEPRRLFAGGTPDPTFGASGAITVPVPLAADRPQLNEDSTRPVELLPDAAGRTIVASHGRDGLTLTRLTADGQIDGKFARGALTLPYTVPFANGVDSYGVDGLDVTLDSDGRLYTLVEGQLRRHTASGRPDTTFGTDGLFGLTAAGFTARRFATIDTIAADGEGRLVGLATAYNRSGREHVNELKLAFRLAGDGTLDKAFGNNGTVTLAIDRDDDGTLDASQEVLRVLSNGAIVAAFQGDATVTSFKLTAAGKADTAYGTKGRGVFADSASGVALGLYGIRSDGQVEAVASTAQQGQKAAGNSPSAFDYTYDLRIAADGKSSRKLTSRANLREPLAVEADGSKWYFNRPAYPALGLGYDTPVVYRTKADGTLDRNFNRGAALEYATAAVAPDGRILVAVQTGRPTAAPSGRVTVARFFPDEGPVAFAAQTIRRISSGIERFSFNVLWQDDDLVDRATLDNNDVILTKGSTTLTARVLSQKVQADGRVLVNYAVAGPGGSWNTAESGTYAVATKTNAVKDTGGIGNTGRKFSTVAVTVS